MIFFACSQIGEPHEENRGLVASPRNVDPSCRNASNPFHQCADYCWTRTPRAKEQREENRAISSFQQGAKHEEETDKAIAGRNLAPNCRNASNPYHQSSEYYTNTDLVNIERKEDKKAEKVGMEIINPNCANASNPYHKCADYCFNK
ncbi:uncharacterized protein LOC141821565 [Curcuma longa]|uniref:uncharacterized protein LOC141821565 n=1 Tax=Curcuma longa TaxID=136217 RepID=UPI003D9EB047